MCERNFMSFGLLLWELGAFENFVSDLIFWSYLLCLSFFGSVTLWSYRSYRNICVREISCHLDFYCERSKHLKFQSHFEISFFWKWYLFVVIINRAEILSRSNCYGPTTNKWKITRQDKLYWSINWCWSADRLFPRLSPFITLDHTSPKIS